MKRTERRERFWKLHKYLEQLRSEVDSSIYIGGLKLKRRKNFHLQIEILFCIKFTGWNNTSDL